MLLAIVGVVRRAFVRFDTRGQAHDRFARARDDTMSTAYPKVPVGRTHRADTDHA
jgi:hypothetical protein